MARKSTPDLEKNQRAAPAAGAHSTPSKVMTKARRPQRLPRVR